MAAAHVKSYSKCLLQDLSKCEEIEQAVRDAVVSREDAEDARMKARKAVKDGLSAEDIEIVMKAYTDIMLACTDEINFGIVFNAKSWLFPEGDAYLAWVRLRAKHQPTTNSQKIMLRREFHRSRLGKATRSPDEWIEEMEIIRSRLSALGVQIYDDDLVMQILEGLPKEYDMLVTLLHARYKIDDLTIESLREELNMYYDRMKTKKPGRFKSSDEDHDDNEESALVTGNFKGRCRGCGKFGHKKSDCPDEKKDKSGNKKFTGKCFHCGKKGHKKADCWKLKGKNQDNANAVTEDDDGSEYALVSYSQVYDDGSTASTDISVNDIIDWRGRLILNSQDEYDNDIIDYTDSEDDENLPFVKIDSRNWNKRSYWRDAEINSDSDDQDSVEVNSDNGSNRYEALCCWHAEDDDDSIDVSNVSSDHEENDMTYDDDSSINETYVAGASRTQHVEVEVTSENEKHDEADNLLSYEEQVQLEREEREVYPIFYDSSNTDADGTASEPRSFIAMADRILEIEAAIQREDHADDIQSAFTNVPMDDIPRLHGSLSLQRHTFGVRGVEFMYDNDESYVSISDEDDNEESDVDTHSSDDYEDDMPQAINNENGESSGADSRETVIETLSPEDEMEAAEGDDDVTDNIYLTEAEWLEVVRNVSFAEQDDRAEEIQDSGGSDDVEMALQIGDLSEDVIDEKIWLGDTGASAHMTMSLKGLYELQEYKGNVTVGNGNKLKVTKIGTKIGTVVQKNGERRRITLKQVKYVPELNCNLLSLTQAMQSGFEITGNSNGMWIKKGAMIYEFDRQFKSGSGILFGLKIDDNVVRTNINTSADNKVKAHVMHAKLGHAGETYTRETCRRLGITLQGPFPSCESCAVSKMKQKNVQKFTENKALEKGERLFLDISHVKGKSSGGSKYWLLIIDEATQFQWSYFLSSKKQTKVRLLELVTDLKATKDIIVRTVRCDNAGENRDADNHLRQAGKGVKFEYTSSDTPQHNGVVERRFASLYGRIRSMLHFCRCPESMKLKIWAECANVSSDLYNIQVQKHQDRCPHELFYGSIPMYARNLQIFGQAGVVLKGGTKPLKAKLKSRGVRKYFVGYAKQHNYDVYRMWDPSTGRVSVTRDIRWLDSMLGDDYGDDGTATDHNGSDDDSVSGEETVIKSEHDDDIESEIEHSEDDTSAHSKNEADDLDVDTSHAPVAKSHDKTESDDDVDMVGNSKLQREPNKLNTFYNPTTDDLGDVAFVGGTDELYENPETFNDAWNHPIQIEREKWRAGIIKEFNDMEKRQVWEVVNIADIPEDRRLIGCRWVNKRKRNMVYRARLVALGYSQIPGVDYTDNFAPVIQDITFRIICVMMIMYGWNAEIVDVETAFLYGDLEETIFMKVPDGYEIVNKDKKIDSSKQCMRLIKTIYGLTQAARQFFKKISAVLTEKLNMKKCLADQCLFGRKTSKGSVLITIYIDDTLCVGKQAAIDELKSDLAKHFSTKEEGPLNEYVGCEVIREGKSKLFMSQQVLLKKLERTFGSLVEKLPIYKTPSGTGFRVERCVDADKRIGDEKQSMYRSGIGMLLFLVKFSRPDISNSVRELSKANDGATEKHFRGLLRTVKYALDTKQKALMYQTGDRLETVWKLKAFCDSDFAGDKETRRSVSGYCIYLFDCLIAWKSKGQKHVTLSSTEAEYVAVSDVCCEIMFIRMILWFLGIKIKLPIVVHCDNVGAIFLSYNAKISQRTKHIDTKYRYVGEWVEDGIVKIVFVKSENNVSDILTKNTSQDTFNRHEPKYLDELPKSKS